MTQSTVDRMTGYDASMLYLETQTHYQVAGSLMLLEPDDAFTFSTLREWLAAQCDSIEIYRQHAYNPWWNVSHPVWRVDPDFDLDNHLHCTKLDPPADEDELLAVCGRIASKPLDLTKPLWEWWLIEGLENGRVAVFSRMHEAILDGVQAKSLMQQTSGLDVGEDTEIFAVNSGSPSDRDIFVTGLRERITRPLHFVRQLLHLILSLRHRAPKPRADLVPKFLQSPRTRFNRTLTPNRNLAYARLSLPAVKAVKNHYGTTVNTVATYLVASALRSYLKGVDDLPDQPLVAYMPKAVHGAPGIDGRNQTSGFLAYLHTDIADDEQRMLKTIESTNASKAHSEAQEATLVSDWARFSSPLWGKAFRLYSRLRLADKHRVVQSLVISNLGGGLANHHLAGARVVDMVPFGPLLDGAALFICMMAFDDKLEVGLMGCPEFTPDLADLARQLPTELSRIAERAGIAADPSSPAWSA
jgi:diacylglycerol O-acyltransferase / wax synthase